MRILRVAQKAYPDVTGGGAYHVHAMSRDQAAMGHDVTLLTVGEGPRREFRDGYEVLRYPSWGAVVGNDIAPGVAWHLVSHADEFDVVHAHSHLYFSTNLAAAFRQLSETPLAITNHGLFSQNAPEEVFHWYLKTVGKWTFNSADVLFCYTDPDRERLREYGVMTDVAVVPNGIDTERFTPGDKIHHAMPDGTNVLFVGRLVEGKRPGDALEGFVGVVEEHPDASMVFAGEGALREELRCRAETLGIAESVRFLGHLEYEEMPSVYRGANVLVLPSRAEGLPRTVLEAMASGVPVVSSHLDHTAPVVRQGGKTVPVGDVEGYAVALNQVLSSQTQLGEQGRRAVVNGFRWENTVAQTTAQLAEIR
ncbi:glycosyltransferase family 4 protein [Salinirubellus salinus]|uniref:Glycosyltransferase family 4 protein n=1 Tax=Salinirubellus salinus TaxID=1364945 RepID=A0A9E7QZG2_9EURY|nr:glycosyltransferase family 4 protein [Salinirubellus salinus]UWM52753.1 glycosyltransferase family 4 protein [Salinirubellus salinus]